jgi:hypothetical protein
LESKKVPRKTKRKTRRLKAINNVPDLSKKTNQLQESLEQLDLKGLLVLNGIITQQALKLILDSEAATAKFKNPLLMPNKSLI